MDEGGRTPTASPRAAATMAAVQSWVNVPDNVLVRISAFLPCRADRVHMAGVNRHWRAAVTGLRRALPPVLPPQLPWVIFPSDEAPTFYSALSGRYHRLCRLPVDIRQARCCGSGDGGWLVLALDSPHAHALYNLNTGRRIPLPPGFRSASDNAESSLVVHAATLSASPSQGRPCVVAAIASVDNRPAVAFWTEGRDSWFSTGDPLAATPQDVIYFAGAFFFLTPGEELIVFGVERDLNGGLTLDRCVRYDDIVPQRRDDYDEDVHQIITLGFGRMKRYLVESRGDLLMVVRDVYYNFGTMMFRVFRLSVGAPATVANGHRPLSTWHWEEVLELDGCMLFLGPGCSRSFEISHYDGFQDQDSMIYFLDESFDSVPMAARLDSLVDMGRSSMEPLTSEPWPPDPLPRWPIDATPTWWLH